MTQLVLQSKLNGARWFWRAVLIGEGLLVVATALTAIFLACFYADCYFVLSREARGHAWQLLEAVGGLLSLAFALPALLRPRSATEIAALVEQRFPQLGERLLSAVEFAQHRSERTDGVSPAMIERLQQDAERAAASLDFRRAIRSPGMPRAATAFVLALLLLALHVWLAGPAFATFLARMSGSDVPVWRDTRVQISPGGTIKLLKGTAFEVTVQQEGKRQKSIRFHYRKPVGGWKEANVPADKSGSASYRFEGLTDPVMVYATAGDGISDRSQVKIVEPAALVGATVRLRYPAYLDLPPTESKVASGGVAAPQGTLVEVELKASRALLKGAATLPGGKPTPWKVTGDRLTGSFPVTRSGDYSLVFTDVDGFPGLPQSFPIKVIPDTAPEIELVRPTGALELVPTAHVHLVFRARDDHGVDQVRVVYQLDNEPPAHRPAGAGDRHARIVEGESDWPLAPLALLPGSTIRYHLEATDFDTVSGPHLSRTGDLQIRIVDRGDAERKYSDDRAQIIQELANLIRQQAAVRAEVEAARARPQQDPVALATAAARQRAVGATAADLARRVSELRQAAELNQLAAPAEVESQRAAEEVLNQVARQGVPTATSRIETAHQQASSAPQSARSELAKASGEQQAVERDLNRAADLLQPGNEIQRLAERFERLGRAQQALAQQSAKLLPATAAKAVADLSPAQQQQLQQLSQQQQSLQRATAQAVQDLTRATETTAKASPAEAEAARKAAEALQDAEVPKGQQQAAQDVQKNALGQAATRQQAAAEALQQVAQKLAQSQNNSAAQDTPPDPLAGAREAVQALVAQQAAINQGTQRLAKQPKPDAAQARALAQRQGEVQRATALLKQTLPGATLQSFAQEAGQAMQRSQAALQNNNPATETRQAQAEALRKLQNVATALDPAALAPAAGNPQAQEQIAALGAVRAAQQALQAQTQALQNQRPPVGPLTPEQQAELNQLGQQQQQLKATTGRLAQQLAQAKQPAGAVQQAEQHMAQAQNGLRQQETGAPTQGEQQAAADALGSALTQSQQAAANAPPSPNGEQPGQRGKQAGKEDRQQQPGIERGVLGRGGAGGHGFSALAPRTQDSLRQSAKEKIPSDYQDLIKRYYRTLSRGAH